MTTSGPVMPKPAVPYGLSDAELQAERDANARRQEAATQRDLAAGRAALSAEQSKRRLGTPAHVMAKDLGAAESGAHSARGVADLVVGSITYREDKQSKSDPNTCKRALDFRIARAECSHVGCKAYTDIPQELPLTGDDWTNKPEDRLLKFGWRFDGVRWFCGDTCRRFWLQVNSEHAGGVTQPQAVTHISDRAYAVKAYATEPVKTAEVATPAAQPTPATPPTRPRR